MEQIIKISTVCKELHICRQTLYSWHKSGKIELMKTLGGQYYIDLKTFESLKKQIKNDSL